MINGFAISGVFIATTCMTMAVLLLVLARSRTTAVWGIFCIAVLMWGVGAYAIGTTTDPVVTLHWWQIAYIGVIFIPPIFLHFVSQFLAIRTRVPVVLLYLISGGYLVANLFTQHFINHTHVMFGSLNYLSPTPLYDSFVIYFIACIVAAHILLFRYYRRTTSPENLRIAYFTLGSTIGFIGGGTSFLPVYHVAIYPYANVTVALFPLIMGYAMLRYRLFDIRVVTAQILVFVLWVFMAIRFFLSWNTDQAFWDGFLFVIIVILGIFLVRSVLGEVEKRDQLRTANARLVELDHLKSQFLSFASHQLKSPLTSIKWQSEMIADGSLGVVPKEVTDASTNMIQGIDRLVTLVNEFLNLRKIEEGKVEYTFTVIDIPDLVEWIVHEIQPLATHKGLTLTFADQTHRRMASADTSQFTQVIQNLVDNAIKYTEKGSVTVTAKNDTPQSIMITITDSGHGMEPGLLPNLFEEFKRASGPTKRIEGTGLGLYIAKEIVTAHKGTVQATSPGPGKGSSFIVRIPSA